MGGWRIRHAWQRCRGGLHPTDPIFQLAETARISAADVEIPVGEAQETGAGELDAVLPLFNRGD